MKAPLSSALGETWTVRKAFRKVMEIYGRKYLLKVGLKYCYHLDGAYIIM